MGENFLPSLSHTQEMEVDWDSKNFNCPERPLDFNIFFFAHTLPLIALLTKFHPRQWSSLRSCFYPWLVSHHFCYFRCLCWCQRRSWSSKRDHARVEWHVDKQKTRATSNPRYNCRVPVHPSKLTPWRVLGSSVVLALNFGIRWLQSCWEFYQPSAVVVSCYLKWLPVRINYRLYHESLEIEKEGLQHEDPPSWEHRELPLRCAFCFHGQH